MKKIVLALSIVALSFLWSLNYSYAQGGGFASVTNLQSLAISANTGEKPQSKCWTYGGYWFAVFSTSSGTNLYRLDGTTWTNVLTLSAATDAHADAKVIASTGVVHILLFRGASSQLVSVEYVSGAHAYQAWSSRPSAASIALDGGVETATIDVDGNGRMWLASDNVTDVNVRWSDSPYSAWSSPITIASGINSDDISVVTALPALGKVGVLWSNQNTQRFGFKTHTDGADPATWSADEVPASQSAQNVVGGMADDHLNVAAATDGTLYAAVKTSYDTPGYAKIALLIRRPAGTWDDLYEVDQAGTRGIVILNEAAGTVKVIYSSAEGGADILYKGSSISSISFGSVNTLMNGGTHNDATSTKQNYSGDVVILASTSTTVVGVLATDANVDSYALDFDGTDDYVNCGTSSSADITGPITLEAWVRPDVAATQSIVKKNGANSGYELSLSNDVPGGLPQNFFFRLNGNTSYRINSASYYPIDGTWVHVAATYDGSVIKLYINGVQEGGTVSGPPAISVNSNNLVIGTDAASVGTKNFNGGIDEVRIWNVARTAQEILDNYSKQLSSGTGLVGRWGMGEGSGTATANSIPGGLNGTLVNGPVWISATPFNAPAIPAIPALISPANSATGVAVNPTLSWNASSGATSYRAQVSTVSDFLSTVYDQSGIITTSAPVIGLSNSTVYYWRVNATNAQGTSGWSTVWSFTTVAGAPAAFNLLTPASGSTGQALSGNLTWQSSSGATGYDVYLDGNNPPTTVVSTNQVGTSYSYSGLANSGTYYWKVVAKNASGSTTATGAPWNFTTIGSTPGVETNGSGYALDFDGLNGSAISDYVHCGNGASLNVTQSLTIEAWVKPTKTYTLSIVKKYGPSTGAYELFCENAAYGRFSFRLNNSNRVNSVSFYNQPLSTWIHVAGTYDYSTGLMRIFVNGKEDDGGTPIAGPTSINTVTNPVVIGTDLTDFSKSFQGNIDEVRIWNTARSEADIRANMNKKLTGTEPGLVGYWRFDETSGTLMRDETANHNDGTMTNMDDPADHVWSGAPLGNASVSDYAGTVPADYTTTISHTNGDGITATGTSGTFTGIQAYRADDNAFRTGATVPSGYTADPLRFWGVKVMGTSTPTYTLVYNYSGNPGVTDENGLKLLKRADHSVAAWSDALATLDMGANTLTHTGATGTEYALGIPVIYQLTVQPTTGGTITAPSSSPINVNYGVPTTITASANTGYSFANWTVVSGSATIANVNSISTTVTLTAGNATVQANFALITTHTITASAGSGGIIDPSGPVTVPNAGNQTFTITQNPGYHVGDVLVDGGSVGAVSTYTFNNVIIDHTISASFALNTYQLSVSATTGGTITAPPSSPVTVNNGVATTIIAVATAGYTFTGWTIISGTGVTIATPSALSTTATLTNGNAEVRANFVLSLVGHWMMDEGSGTTLVDASTYGNNATTYGSPTWTTGVHGQALALNGLTQYAVVPASLPSSSLNITGPITVAAWIQPTAIQTQRIVARLTGSAGYEFFLTQPSPSPVSFRINNQYRLNSNSTYPTDGTTWMHVAATWDGSNMRMYINGVLETTGAQTVAPVASTDNLGIGATSAGTNNFYGRLDDVRMYNRALTLSEIQALASHTITASAGGGGGISPLGVVSVLHNTNQTFTITPDEGYVVSGVTVDGVPQGALTTYTFNNVIIGHTISATFVPLTVTHTITASAGANGSINPSGAVSVNDGASQAFSITSADGHHVADVLVDLASVGAVTSYTFNNVTADHAISASFAINTYTLNITVLGGGSVPKIPDQPTYNHGTIVELTATPAVGGWTFSGWSGDTSGTTNPLLVQMNRNRNITAIFTNPNTLVAHWAMEEGSGTTLIDSSTYVNNGTILGSPSWVPGMKGQALSFNGTNQYVAVRDTPSLRIWNTITLAAWIAPIRGTVQQRIISKAVGGITDGYELTLSSGGEVFFRLNQLQNGGGGWKIQSTTLYPTDGTTWMHIAGTYDGAVLHLYINGVEEATWPVLLTIATNTDSLYIGRQKDPANLYWYAGKMDEARVYSRGLTLPEIQALAGHTILASAGLNGSISPSGSVNVTHNANQPFTITPAPGYLVADVLVDGGSVGVLTSYTFNSVIANHTISATFVASNLPPESPTLITPLDASSGISRPPTLNISVHDPEGDPMTVTFYGKPSSESIGGDFTIIDLPDAQNYTGNLNGGSNAIFKAQTQWIVSQRAVRNIVYATQIGDIVENGDNDPIEWYRADTAMRILEDPITTGLPEGIPHGVCVGNHDGAGTYFNQYFGSAHFAAKSYYGGHYGTNNNNNFQLFDASGMSFIVVNFEYDDSPAPALLHWADSLLKTYSNRRAIVCDHYLMDVGNPGPFSSAGGLIYDSLKDNPNLFLMLGGHTGDDGRRSDTYNGHTVYSLLADYQGRANGGNGWLRIMEFSPSSGEMRVKTYSPTLDQFETTSNSQFTLSYTMDVNGYEVINTNVNVPSGSSTSIQWPALMPLTQYDWYVTLDDGHNVTTGPTWSFTTRDTSYIITASADVNGTISPNGAVTVGHGASQSFTITANSGYHIASVVVDGVPVGTTSPYVFSSVTADHTIVATFAPVGGSPETVTCNTTGTEYSFPLSSLTMTFSVLPAGGGSVTVRRYLEPPPYPTYPDPPTGSTYIPVWFDITSTLPNNSFSGSIMVDVTGVTGFGADSKAMYYNATSAKWVLVSGMYNGGAHTFTFSTTHFTTFAFINSPFPAYDAFISTSPSVASAGVVYPNATWDAGYPSLSNDWGYTGAQPFSLYIAPQPGTRIGACELIAEWDSSVTSLDAVIFTGSIFSGSNLLFAGSNRLGAGDRVTLNASMISPVNVTTTSGDYIARLDMRLRKPGHGVVSLIGDHVSYFNIGSDPSDVYITPHQADVKAYLGDVTAPGDETTGDGRIDFQDLSMWSTSYWSGVSPNDMTHYKAKYDIGPTQDGYVFSVPTYDHQINFEDLVVFAITYGQTVQHQLPKVQLQREPVVVSLGQAEMRGDETRVSVMIAGSVADVRAMRIEVDGQFGSLVGVDKGVLLQSYSTPVMVMSSEDRHRVFIDLAVMGTEAQGVNREGEIITLRFAGTTAVHLSKAECRSSMNTALAVELMKGTVGATPTRYELGQNYPNPFNPSTTFEYQLPEAGQVKFEVFNILGEHIATLVNEVQDAGFYQLQWDGKDYANRLVASGIYIYRLGAGQFTSAKRMLLLK